MAVSTVPGCRARARDISYYREDDLVTLLSRQKWGFEQHLDDGDERDGLYDSSGCLVSGWNVLADLVPASKRKHPSAH